MDLKDVQPYIEGKICMVTGGGGSIGSEIVRSLSKLNAEKIVIVDIYENGAYSVKCEVGDKVTVVRATLRNGFELVESSACVSPENYDEKMGAEICMEKIKDKVWFLLGFLLQTGVNGLL